MMSLPIERDIVVKRMEGIESELEELRRLAAQSKEAFSSGDGHKLAQYHLHRALEGVFNIGSHILSRIPGGTATQYKEIAQKLGEFKIVPKEFADGKLTEMAKYRNRLVHFYAQVSPQELYQLLQKNLGDFDTFLSSVKDVLLHPETYQLAVR